MAEPTRSLVGEAREPSLGDTRGAGTAGIPEPGMRRLPAFPLRVMATAGLVVVVATMAAVAVSLTRPHVYGAEARILVNTRGYDSEPEAARALATQRLILRSDPVLGSTAVRHGLRLADLRRAVTVRVIDVSEVLSVVVAHRDRATAHRLAEDIVVAYTRDAVASQDADLAELSALLDRLRAWETARAAVNPDTIDDLASLEDRLTAIREQAQSVDVKIVSPARVLDTPLQPRPVQAAAAGLLVGLLLGAGVLFGWRMTVKRR